MNIQQIVLVGFRGAGKTTLGREMAKHKNVPFMDLDEEVEFTIGCTIYEFVDKFGWQVFREVEQKIVQVVSRDFSGVIATGGGTIENSKNLQNLKKRGKFIFINPNFSAVKKYLLKDNSRPRLDPSMPLAQEIDQMWMQRKDIYRATADYEAEPDYNGKAKEEAVKIWEKVVPADVNLHIPEIKKLVILSSSNGTVVDGLIKKQSEGRIPNVKFSCLITDKEDAGVIDIARKHNIPVEIVIKDKDLTREEYDRTIINAINTIKPDIIILAGWMKILSQLFCDNFNNKAYNVHPSLLPAYAGLMDMEVHEKVIQDGEGYTGATVHKVISEVDKGDIVVQRKIPVNESDTADTLKEKVQRQEILAFCDLLEK